jgi:hypothetical protein
MLKQISIAAVLTITITAAKTQTIANKSFAGITENLPMAPDSLVQSLEMYGRIPMDETPAAFRTAMDELNAMREEILRPLYDKLITAGKGNTAGYSPEEQKLLRDMQTLRSAWGDGVMYGFNTRIEYRPGIAKQFWTKPKQPLSTTAQSCYNRLVQIEKSLNWERFLEEAHDREGLVFHDDRLDVLNEQMNEALAAVPVKKQKFAEGSDVMVDMPDREKTIEVMKKYDEKRMKMFKQIYHEQHTWWQINYTRTVAAAKSVDSILQATRFGEGLQGNDAQLRNAIADVQGRIAGLLYHLTNISAKIISIAQQAYVSGQATEEYVRNTK